MKNNKHNSFISLLLIFMIIAVTGMGCIKENRTQCDVPILLTFKAIVNVNGVDIEVGEDMVKELTLYVFNAKEEFIESHRAKIASTITLSYPNHKELHFVCWANSENDQQIIPNLNVGDKLDESIITLNTESVRSEQEKVVVHPDNLFHSKKQVVIAELGMSTIVMVLRHKVASVSITAKGLNTITSKVDDDYSFVLRSGKKHVNYNGNTQGNDVHHYQDAELKEGIHESGIFNILPSNESKSGSNIEVDIYKGTELIHVITEDSSGGIIKAKEGELLNIHADFSDVEGDVTISVAVTPWGEKMIWKEL